MHPKFKAERSLGQGAFGRVWLAKDTETGRWVAVKELLHADADHLQRLDREARILKSLQGDPFVVGLIGYDLTWTPPYLVLEFCLHGSLRPWVAMRRSWRDVASAIACASRGLQRIHKAGGFHRDVKPDNLLLTTGSDRRLVVKVADFGVARVPVTNHPPMTRSAWGTEGYIAPEVLAGEQFTAAADVYSLGVTAAELLTGTKDRRALATVAMPPALRALVATMTDPIRQRRPGVVQVAARLDHILKAPAPSVASPSPLAWPAPAAGDASGGGNGLLVAAGFLALAAILAASDGDASGG